MSTKVKGDKIKEGSIPLSALKPNMYNLSNNEDINEVKKAISEFKVGFTIIQNSFYSNVYITNISKVGGNVYNITGIHEGMTFKVTIDINKISNPLFTEDNKIDVSGPTPDWNAQIGETGYIENKPFTIGDKWQKIDESLIKYDVDPFDEEDTYSININLYELKCALLNVYFDEIKTRYILYKPDYIADRGTISIPIGNYQSCEAKVIQDGVSLRLEIHDHNYAGWKAVANTLLYVVDDFGKLEQMEYYIEKVNPIFIPDTIIKTTPQTLSDTDKNQALTNLGIDPIVWKYLCNPCILKNKKVLPSELRNDIEFKYPNRGMYVVEHNNILYNLELLNEYEGQVKTEDLILTVFINSDGTINISD